MVAFSGSLRLQSSFSLNRIRVCRVVHCILDRPIMRIVCSPAVVLVLLVPTTHGFAVNSRRQRQPQPQTALFAKKKTSAKEAALAALDAPNSAIAWDDEDDEPKLSKKDLLKKMKGADLKESPKEVTKEPAAKAVTKEPAALAWDDEDDEPKLSKKDLLKKLKGLDVKDSPPSAAAAAATEEPAMSAKMKKMLAMDAADEAMASPEPQGPKLSGKEMKALQKKQEKEEARLAKKAAKKLVGPVDEGEDGEEEVVAATKETEVQIGTNDDEELTAADEPPQETLEEKIRKERPPPRIRVMESAQPGYAALRLERIGITFRDQQVLSDVTWGVQTGDRIGLVGQNGAGKTTQLRILAGELEPTTGDVVKSSKDLRVSMLRQEFVDELVKDRTLREEFMSVFTEETKLLEDIREAERELECMTEADADRMQVVLDKMQDLQGKADAKGVYALESQVQKIMDLMGFTPDEGDDLVGSFSGGWKMRIGLGKVLLKDPNILLLDEPTNHLDLDSVEWLEAFLRQQKIPTIIVSHDREFLDQVCTKIVDAEGGHCTEYDGNYSRFLTLKKSRMDAWHAAWEAQEKKVQEDKAFIRKFKIQQPQAVKQRQAKLDKMSTQEDYVQKPPFLGKPFRFRFPDAPRLSPEVAQIKALSHAYRNGETANTLFDEVDLFVEKGDRIAVVGPNGAGKSTLLRFLLGRERPDDGQAEIIGQNVAANYFEQNQADALDLDKTVMETVQAASQEQSYNEMRALLGQFLFKGDAVEKKVRFLSGGEKARLSLCCMMLKPANLLVLDEPTNHLDIPAKEMLEEALQHFAGSVMVISHDRYFISKVATSIVAIEDKKLAKYQGDYKFYMEKSKFMQEKIEARYVPGVERIESAPIIDLETMLKPKGNFGGAKTAGMVTRKDKGIKNAKRMVQ